MTTPVLVQSESSRFRADDRYRCPPRISIIIIIDGCFPHSVGGVCVVMDLLSAAFHSSYRSFNSRPETQARDIAVIMSRRPLLYKIPGQIK